MKIGRNDPCPCGSGKKYKNCCMDSKIIPFPGTALNGENPTGPSPLPPSNRPPLSPDEFFGMDPGFDFDQAMAEYTDFCESLPPGAPVPTFNEYAGKANLATDLINTLRTEVEERGFSSQEEAESYISQRIEEMNQRELPEFLGLTPTIMQSIINGRLDDNRDLVTLNRGISSADVKNTPIIRRVEKFFAVFSDYASGKEMMPLTTTGRLKREFCHRYFEAISGKDRSQSWITNADNYPALQALTFMLNETGYIQMLRTRCKLTDKGRAFLAEGDPAGIYLELFIMYLEELNWSSLLHYFPPGSIDLLQDAALFSLYILKEKADGKRTGREIFTFFREAFWNDLRDDQVESYGDFLYVTHEALFLSDFCSQFGLITQPFKPEEYITTEERGLPIITTPLFRKLFHWKR